MNRYRITVAYDGANYYGWQRQPGDKISIQQKLEEAVAPLAAPNPCTVFGSGRTDAGVHARGAVAHFDLEREIKPTNLRRALNGALPDDIRVIDAAPAAPDFDARRSAHGKEYRYFIVNGEAIFPDERRYAAHVRKMLDIDAMRAAAARFVGQKDFAAFSANPNREVGSTVRNIYSLDVLRSEDMRRVELRVCGDGFLYKMVRSISGFLMSVGKGMEKPEAVDEILESRIRTSRVETAPACGLFLWRVWYE